MDDSYLDTTPLREPPPGKVADLVHPESQSYKLIIFLSVMTALVVLFTGGRIYTRLKITRSFGADDCKCSYPFTRTTIGGYCANTTCLDLAIAAAVRL